MIDRFYRFLLESWNFSALYAGLMGLWIFSWSGPISGYLHSHVNTICIRRRGLCMATSHGRILPLSHIIVGGKKIKTINFIPTVTWRSMFIKVKNFWKNKQTTWNRLFLPSCTIRLTFTVKITTQLLCILYLYLKYIEASDIRTTDIGTLRDVQKVLDIKYSFIISSTFRAEKGFKMFCKHLFKKSDGLWIYDTDIFDLSL